MEPASDEEIIKRILNGHIQDFWHIVRRYQGMAYKTAFSVTRHHEDAQEVAQDAFMKAFSSLASFKGLSRFSTWFFRIVYYTALNHLEKSKAYQRRIRPDGDLDPDSFFSEDGFRQLADKDQAQYIGRALELLVPDDRLALSLYYLDGYPQPEIAELTGWSLASTKQRIHRARTRLDQALTTLLNTEKKDLL